MTTTKQYILKMPELETLSSALEYRKSLSNDHKVKLNLCWNNQEGFFLYGYSDKVLYC